MTDELLARRRAFTGMLTHPVADRRRHPELFALVRDGRHRSVLMDWFKARLGYDLVVTESAARLFRRPLGPEVLAPRPYAAPGRRVLTLAVLAAAVAEDTEDLTTTQDLSDRVRVLTGREDTGLAGYDPDRFQERTQFVHAVGVLVDAGVLRPMDRDARDRREGWARQRDSVGGAYGVERELLLRLVDPLALDSVLAGADVDPGSDPELRSRHLIMRRLIELPVCLYADLDEPERVYLTRQRHRLLAWCHEMTGWVVEQRAEGLALIAAEEDDTDLPFPRLRALDFVALLVLEALCADADQEGSVTDEQIGRAVADVRFRYPSAMTRELDSDLATRDKSIELLRALDLMRPAAEGWWLSPAAARFRNPTVVAATARLDEEVET